MIIFHWRINSLMTSKPMNKIISITFVGGIIIPLSRVLIFPNQTLILNLDFVQFREGGDYGCSKFLRIFLVNNNKKVIFWSSLWLDEPLMTYCNSLNLHMLMNKIFLLSLKLSQCSKEFLIAPYLNRETISLF